MLSNRIETSVFTDDITNDLFYEFNHAIIGKEFCRTHDELKEYAFKIKDTILGISSGSYTCNRECAKENVMEYFGIFYDAVNWYDVTNEQVGIWFLMENWEYMDLICREYIFDKYLDDFIDEYLMDYEDDI